jgi:hypothetical protein
LSFANKINKLRRVQSGSTIQFYLSSINFW